jgi:hypothetical protein
VGFPQSRFAYASIDKPTPWFVCDRCGFRKMKSESAWQFDYRGLQLQNLRVLVCQICLDKPQPQLKPIIIGPDPVPVKDPRPGFAATQMGVTYPVNVLELVDGDLFPGPAPPFGLYNNGGVLALTPNGAANWPDADPGIPGKLWSNFFVVTASFPLKTVANPQPIYWNVINSNTLLAGGANVIRTTQPAAGSNEIWINVAMGGEVWVALPAFGVFSNDGGVLVLLPPGGYPTAPDGLPPGSVWSNGLAVSIIPGILPNPSAPPLFFGSVQPIDLLQLGGGNLPLSPPTPGSLQLWNNGGLACVA